MVQWLEELRVAVVIGVPWYSSWGDVVQWLVGRRCKVIRAAS